MHAIGHNRSSATEAAMAQKLSETELQPVSFPLHLTAVIQCVKNPRFVPLTDDYGVRMECRVCNVIPAFVIPHSRCINARICTVLKIYTVSVIT